MSEGWVRWISILPFVLAQVLTPTKANMGGGTYKTKCETVLLKKVQNASLKVYIRRTACRLYTDKRIVQIVSDMSQVSPPFSRKPNTQVPQG